MKRECRSHPRHAISCPDDFCRIGPPILPPSSLLLLTTFTLRLNCDVFDCVFGTQNTIFVCFRLARRSVRLLNGHSFFFGGGISLFLPYNRVFWLEQHVFCPSDVWLALLLLMCTRGMYLSGLEGDRSGRLHERRACGPNLLLASLSVLSLVHIGLGRQS